MAALAETGNVTEAARCANYDRVTAYHARNVDPEFAQQWTEAIDVAIEKLELEARRRAYEGTNKGVWHQGELVGTEKVYSDTLMIFLLKAHRPEKYRDNFSVEHSGIPPMVLPPPLVIVGVNAAGECTDGTRLDDGG